MLVTVIGHFVVCKLDLAGCTWSWWWMSHNCVTLC